MLLLFSLLLLLMFLEWKGHLRLRLKKNREVDCNEGAINDCFILIDRFVFFSSSSFLHSSSSSGLNLVSDQIQHVIFSTLS